MPYVDAEWRIKCINEGMPRLIEFLRKATKNGKENNGVVVYVIYKILQVVYGEGRFEEKSNALKVLESAKLEYYRRILAPYEDKKIGEHGDV